VGLVVPGQICRLHGTPVPVGKRPAVHARSADGPLAGWTPSELAAVMTSPVPRYAARHFPECLQCCANSYRLGFPVMLWSLPVTPNA
jgi:hypothetical protein